MITKSQCKSATHFNLLYSPPKNLDPFKSCKLINAICLASSFSSRYVINSSLLIDGRSFNESVLLTNLYFVLPAINCSKSSYQELATAGRLVSTNTLVTSNCLTKS